MRALPPKLGGKRCSGHSCWNLTCTCLTSYGKSLTETLLAVASDICDLGVFQTYCMFGNASITNIYLPASFGNAYYHIAVVCCYRRAGSTELTCRKRRSYVGLVQYLCNKHSLAHYGFWRKSKCDHLSIFCNSHVTLDIYLRVTDEQRKIPCRKSLSTWLSVSTLCDDTPQPHNRKCFSPGGGGECCISANLHAEITCLRLSDELDAVGCRRRPWGHPVCPRAGSVVCWVAIGASLTHSEPDTAADRNGGVPRPSPQVHQERSEYRAGYSDQRRVLLSTQWCPWVVDRTSPERRTDGPTGPSAYLRNVYLLMQEAVPISR